MIQEEVRKLILATPVGNPIIVGDIVTELKICDKNGRSAVNMALKRMMAEDLTLRHYKRGIYYRCAQTPFGETGIDKSKLIQRKYIRDTGYKSGVHVLHDLGLTTLMTNRPLRIVANVGQPKFDKELNVYVEKPKTLLTKCNKRYFQLLDVIEWTKKVLIDEQNPIKIYLKFILYYGIKYDRLFYYAVKFYNKEIVDAVRKMFEESCMEGESKNEIT